MTAILVDEAGVRAVADPADIRSRVGQGAFFWLDLVGGDRSARTAWLAELGEVGLGADLVESYPHELSVGQRQR